MTKVLMALFIAAFLVMSARAADYTFMCDATHVTEDQPGSNGLLGGCFISGANAGYLDSISILTYTTGSDYVDSLDAAFYDASSPGHPGTLVATSTSYARLAGAAFNRYVITFAHTLSIPANTRFWCIARHLGSSTILVAQGDTLHAADTLFTSQNADAGAFDSTLQTNFRSGVHPLAVTIYYSSGGSAPSAPTLSSPSNGATGQSTSPTLSWNASSGATSYALQVSSTSGNYSSPDYSQSGLTSTAQQVTGLNYSATYYWHVSATNSYGTSSYSTEWSFTTAAQSQSSGNRALFHK